MADVQILRASASTVPSNYTLPDATDLRLKAVYADFTDAGAAADWLPCVTILSDSGDVIARAADQDIKVTAGDDAAVSWFPRVRRRRAAVTPSGPSCVLLGSGNGNTTLTITLTKAVPAKGTLQVVFAQVSVPDGVDAGSDCTAVVDSGAHGPWARPAAPGLNPVIGDNRQTDAGNAFSAQDGSVARACATGDLGIGSTITLTFSSVAPANFHTTGLVIYMPAYYVAVKQGGIVRFNTGDAHPNVGASLTTMSWDIDYGPPPWRNADQDALMITAMGSYPPVAGFSPLNGSVIGEITSGSVGVAAGCIAVCEGSMPDPGGTWPAGASALFGGYQVAQPRTCSTL